MTDVTVMETPACFMVWPIRSGRSIFLASGPRMSSAYSIRIGNNVKFKKVLVGKCLTEMKGESGAELVVILVVCPKEPWLEYWCWGLLCGTVCFFCFQDHNFVGIYLYLFV